MNVYLKRNRLSPEKRLELQKQLQDKYKRVDRSNVAVDFTKRPTRSGVSARLLKGEDVEKHLTEKFNQYSKETEETINKKTERAIENLNNRIDAVLRYMQRLVETKAAAIHQPNDGHTPTPAEIEALLEPKVAETRKQLEARMSKVDEFFKKLTLNQADGIPQDLKGLEDFIKKVAKPQTGGGGGPGHFFDLLDVPNKAKGYKGPYINFIGKVLQPSADGKRLVFADVPGGAGGMTTLAANEAPDGSRTEFTFDEAPTIIATEFGFFIEDATHGFTLSGTTATLPIAPNNFIRGYK